MSDVPSSGWCTNWSAYNTPRLWAMVAGEDNPEAWKQVNAWREVSGDVDAHLAHLVQSRDALRAAWPPEQNEASRAFLTELNALIARMGGARDDASTTSVALDNILKALGQAKNNIEPLWRQYEEKRGDAVPAWWDGAEEELDNRARAHMLNAEQVVQQYVPTIAVPLPYKFALSFERQSGDPDLGRGSSSASSSSADPIFGPSSAFQHSPPPPLPGHPAAFQPALGGASQTGFFPPGDGVSQYPDSREAITVRPPSGPELSEVVPAPPPAPYPTPAPPPAVPPSGGLPPGGVIGGPGLFPVGGGRGAAPGVRPSGGGMRQFGGRPPAAMPSGVVIGGLPMAKPGSGPGGGAVRGIAPMTKPVLPSWLPGGSGQSGAMAAGMPLTAGRKGDVGDEPAPRFDLDSPWGVAQGVAPVIEPSRRNAVHDTGPGVIGQHR